MKKITYLLASLFVASMFMACGGDDPLPQVVPVTGVTITAPTTIALYVGQSHQLEAIVAPVDADNPAVTWTSSAPAIASVNATGLVTANATNPGTATITVTTTDGSFTATATITVAIPAVLVQGVTIEGEDEIDLIVGEGLQLYATVTPDDADNTQIDWESSHPNIVHVIDGFIFAITAGTATITVTTVCGNHTASVEVTVSIIPVEYFTLYCGTETGDALEMELDDTRQFNVVILPANATHEGFEWESSDIDVVTVTSAGLVTARGVGTATITVTADCYGEYPYDGFYIEFTITVLPVGHPTEEDGVLLSYTVDGVPMSVRWATRNVGAPGTFAARNTSPGMFYQWNRRAGWFRALDAPPTGNTTRLTRYDGETHIAGENIIWDATNPLVANEGPATWVTANDPCPPGWRIPTRDEFRVLLGQGHYFYENWNGVRGRLFGTYPNQVFLPMPGWVHPGGTPAFNPNHVPGGPTSYWTSERNAMLASAHRLQMPFAGGAPQHINNASPATNGYNIRCVAINP